VKVFGEISKEINIGVEEIDISIDNTIYNKKESRVS